MLNERIGMCARKGFDAVELDDIDSFDPPSTTGFQLTPGDLQNFLAYAFNLIHADGMTGLWKNSPLLSWWGRQYADGAVVEECYSSQQCFASQFAGSRQYGITCTALSGPTPCGWDDFTAAGSGSGRPSTPRTATSAIRVRCAKGRTRSVPTAARCTRSRTVSRPSSSTSTWTASSSIPAHDN